MSRKNRKKHRNTKQYATPLSIKKHKEIYWGLFERLKEKYWLTK